MYVCLFFCTDISKKTSKHVSHWLGKAKPSSTWSTNNRAFWVLLSLMIFHCPLPYHTQLLQPRQERKREKNTFFSGNHMLSSNIKTLLKTLKSYSYCDFSMFSFFFPLLLLFLWSFSINPVASSTVTHLYSIYICINAPSPVCTLRTQTFSVVKSSAKHRAENLLGGAGRCFQIRE